MKTEEIQSLFEEYEQVACEVNQWNVGAQETCRSCLVIVKGKISQKL